MNRAYRFINAFSTACFFVGMTPLKADESQCSIDVEKVEITTNGVGVETEIRLKGSVNLTVPLLTIGGQSRFESLSVSAQRDDLWELIYYAGSAGTSYMVEEFRKVIIDPCNQKVLGEAELRYIPQDGEDEANWEQPQWIWGSDNLYVKSEGYGSEHMILPPEKISGPHQFQDFKTNFDYKKQWENLPSDAYKEHHHVDELKEAAMGNIYPNFAGKFRFMYFGCGTGCSGIGILNKETGELFEPDFVVHRGFQQQERMVQYRVDSQLIILTGSLNEGSLEGVHYFHFDGKALIPLK